MALPTSCSSSYQVSISNRRVRSARHWIGAILALILLAGCASNPSSGGSSVVVGSQGREVEIGNEMHAQMMAEGAAYDDPELQAYVNRVGQRLVTNSDKPNMKFTFTVIDSPDINAFALPGGYIYMNRGLLSYLDSEAEMAGVLSHELGHVNARHTAERLSAAQMAQLGMVLGAVGGAALGLGSEAAQISQQIAMLSIQSYSRKQEFEADTLGVAYARAFATDPRRACSPTARARATRARAGGAPSGSKTTKSSKRWAAPTRTPPTTAWSWRP